MNSIFQLLDLCSPKKNKKAAEVLEFIFEIISEIPEDTAQAWDAKFEELYGALEGQRKVSTKMLSLALCKDITDKQCKEAVFSLQIYYALILEVISIWACNKQDEYIRLHTTAKLKKLISGELLKDYGINRTFPSFGYEWFVDLINSEKLIIINEFISALQENLSSNNGAYDTKDPFSMLYNEIFPKDLLHSSGEFYTPHWLATLSLSDISYDCKKGLIDPFCGSGIFAVAAIEKAIANGMKPEHILDKLLLIDTNPLACLQTQAAILMCFRTKKADFKSKLTLPILNGSSLVPALIHQQTSMFALSTPVNILGIKVLAAESNQQSLINSDDIAPLKRLLGDRIGAEVDKFSFKLAPNSQTFSNQNCLIKQALIQHAVICNILQQEYLATNPPWVGWEYIPRDYRSSLTLGWERYDLLQAKGRDKAFLKEDIANLATVAAIDLYLKDSGKAAFILKPSLMKSSLAARGLRRLSLYERSDPFNLKKIRLFHKLSAFDEAAVDTMTWSLEKGQWTSFPVPVKTWEILEKGVVPLSKDTLKKVRSLVHEKSLFANRIDPGDNKSAWAVSANHTDVVLRNTMGKSEYKARAGLFTGGANAVFYLEKLGNSKDIQQKKKINRYRNVVERAKRIAPVKEMNLEEDLVYKVLRGKDIQRWYAEPGALILCPHSEKTKMFPISEKDIQEMYPLTFDYLLSMKEILDERGGFSGWEAAIKNSAFYSIQRIGEYSFAPYKVVWKYIAEDFITAVICTSEDGKPALVNDKVVSIASWDKEEAYYICGILSSTLARLFVTSTTVGTQISVSAIQNFKLDKYERNNILHRQISTLCQEGHILRGQFKLQEVLKIYNRLDKVVNTYYQVSDEDARSLFDQVTVKFSKQLFSIKDNGSSASSNDSSITLDRLFIG